MKLGEYLEKELVLPELTASTKQEALAELLAPVVKKNPSLDAEEVFNVLMEREALGTTGIGNGIAIPHGKLSSLDKIVVVAGRSFDGLDFDALDQKPCKIFFMVLAPENVAGTHLRILAQISRLLKDEDFKQLFMESDTQETLWNLLSAA